MMALTTVQTRNSLMTNYGLTKMSAHNKAMQSDSATCHALCVPHKGAPGCSAVDGGVMCKGSI
jgi:hypothetical protein